MQKRKAFRHLIAGDRDRIHALYGYGYTRKAIADVLGVHKSTVTRELARYGRKTWRYSATRAQEDAEEKRAHSKRPGMKVAEHPEMRRYIIQQLKRLRSPDEIAGRMKRVGVHPRVGTNAIYKWLYSDDGKPYCRYLCTRRSRKRKQSRQSARVLIPDRISLRHRPDSPGLVHAEGDLFVSPTRLHSKHCGLIVVEQGSKLLSGSVIPSKTRAVIVPAMHRVTACLALDTCTFDNGIENVPHRDFGVPAYFCDKGAPWQKPHVEGSIGLVRRWFLPKGTDLAGVPDTTFQSQLHLLNGKYRRSLGYASAYEVALERGILKRIPKVSLAEAVAFR
jgi:IS30 family transposase